MFRKAAEQGDARAQKEIGESYRVGLGVQKDVAQADYWLQKAADNSNSLSKAPAPATLEELIMGTPIDFTSLYAKVNSGGLELGKRYMVNTNLNSRLDLLHPQYEPESGVFIYAEHDFDDSGQLEASIRMAVNRQYSGINCTVVVSMGNNHHLLLNCAEDCL